MAGKGSKQRPTDLKKFNNNFDVINWKSKKTTKEQTDFDKRAIVSANKALNKHKV